MAPVRGLRLQFSQIWSDVIGFIKTRYIAIAANELSNFRCITNVHIRHKP